MHIHAFSGVHFIVHMLEVALILTLWRRIAHGLISSRFPFLREIGAALWVQTG